MTSLPPVDIDALVAEIDAQNAAERRHAAAVRQHNLDQGRRLGLIVDTRTDPRLLGRARRYLPQFDDE